MRRVVVWAGMLAAVPAVPMLAQLAPLSNPAHDSRLATLKAFFEKAGSPIKHLASDFLIAADRHHLDWRLLPSISLVETGAGKTSRGNNIFGWDCGRKTFTSIRDAIYQVAARLSNSKLYRGKNTDGILATYNRHSEYRAKVKSVMRRLHPDAPAHEPTQAAELRVPIPPGPEPPQQ